jgi:ABC-2 type transport system permease protein
VSPILIIFRKEMQQLLRDKGALRLLFAMPLVQLIVLGFAITTEVRHTPYMWVDHCKCTESRDLLRRLPLHDLFIDKGEAADEATLRQAMDQGRIRLGLVLPADFGTRLMAASDPRTLSEPKHQKPPGASLQMIVDGQDANSASVARGYLTAIATRWSMQWLEARLQAQGLSLEEVLPIRVGTQVLFNPLLQSPWYMVPGIGVILVTIVTALLTGFSIVREKESGTLEQLMVTPLQPVALVLGKAMPFFFLGLIELFAILGLAVLLFQVPFEGNLFALALFASAYMLSSLGIGILTSAVVKTQQQALFVIWFFLLFFLLLSGFFMPIENMPAWVQTLTYANPVRYFMVVLREMFLKGSGPAELWRELLAMLAIGGTVFTLAVLLFKRKAA